MLHKINNTMFRPGDLKPSTTNLLSSDEEDTSDEEEEEEEEEEEHGPEVMALIYMIDNIINHKERVERRYTRLNETADVVDFLLPHTGRLDYNLVKNILKRRRLERRMLREDRLRTLRGLRTIEEANRFLNADDGWMVKIMESWSETVPHFDQTRERIVFTPWHGENPDECDITGLTVCCKLTNHIGPYPGPTYPLWRRSENPIKIIDELMREKRVFSDVGCQVWVQLTKTEFQTSFSGKYKDEAIHEYMREDLLKRVVPGMHPGTLFEEYRRLCTVTCEDRDDANLAATFYPRRADQMDEMSEGGNRSQKKHKPKHKTKTKTKTKPKTKTKSKCKTKSKSKSKCKTTMHQINPLTQQFLQT